MSGVSPTMASGAIDCGLSPTSRGGQFSRKLVPAPLGPRQDEGAADAVRASVLSSVSIRTFALPSARRRSSKHIAITLPTKRLTAGTATSSRGSRWESQVQFPRGRACANARAATGGDQAGEIDRRPRNSESRFLAEIAPRSAPLHPVTPLRYLQEQCDLQRILVGETGFEPATARPPAGCATRLRHSPLFSSSEAGDGNRTRPKSLEGSCATTTLRPRADSQG